MPKVQNLPIDQAVIGSDKFVISDGGTGAPTKLMSLDQFTAYLASTAKGDAAKEAFIYEVKTAESNTDGTAYFSSITNQAASTIDSLTLSEKDANSINREKLFEYLGGGAIKISGAGNNADVNWAIYYVGSISTLPDGAFRMSLTYETGSDNAYFAQGSSIAIVSMAHGNQVTYNGAIILHGSGAPSIETGDVNDFYIDVDDYDIYGPKTQDGWGDPTSLIGDLEAGTPVINVLDPDENPTVAVSIEGNVATFTFGIPAAADVSVGSTITGSPGTNASVSNTGSDGNVVLDFIIPQGAKGDQGEVSVGTTTTLSPGVAATVTDQVPDDPNKVILDFGIPEGQKGDQGDSVDNVTYTGGVNPGDTTEATFEVAGEGIGSVTIQPGVKGDTGESYAIARVYIAAGKNNPPDAPSDTTDFQFTEGSGLSFTVPSGWSQSIPDHNSTQHIYATEAIVSGDIDTDITASWSTPRQFTGDDGTDGANAQNPVFTAVPTTVANKADDTFGDATATITGTYPNLNINLGLPAGSKGDKGDAFMEVEDAGTLPDGLTAITEGTSVENVTKTVFVGSNIQLHQGTGDDDDTIYVQFHGSGGQLTESSLAFSAPSHSADRFSNNDTQTVTLRATPTANDGTLNSITFTTTSGTFDNDSATKTVSSLTDGTEVDEAITNLQVQATVTATLNYTMPGEAATDGDAISHTLNRNKSNPSYSSSYTFTGFDRTPKVIGSNHYREAYDSGTITSVTPDGTDNNGWDADTTPTQPSVSIAADASNDTLQFGTYSWTQANPSGTDTLSNHNFGSSTWHARRTVRYASDSVSAMTSALIRDLDNTNITWNFLDSNFTEDPDGEQITFTNIADGERLYIITSHRLDLTDSHDQNNFPISGFMSEVSGQIDGFYIYRSDNAFSATSSYRLTLHT